jgi:hypothetical protein
VLWIDYSWTVDPPPDSVTVSYSVTAGDSANGLSVGSIASLYEGHPGVKSVRNLTITTGAIPARSQREIIAEVTTRLRQRDRALTFKDISAWAEAFDPRIKMVNCANGVQRIGGGVCRCISVTAKVDPEGFCSKDEIELLKSRLKSFLTDRSGINVRYTVEVETS